jgi:hypothetical protein
VKKPPNPNVYAGSQPQYAHALALSERYTKLGRWFALLSLTRLPMSIVLKTNCPLKYFTDDSGIGRATKLD